MRHNNTSYFMAFLVYEVLGAAVAVGNLFLTNRFLEGKFFYFGIGVSKYLTSSVTDVNNPLNEVFPKVGTCPKHPFLMVIIMFLLLRDI